MRYDGLCLPAGPSRASAECHVIASADVRNARDVTLCVTEAGEKACESATAAFVALLLDFEP